MNVLIKIIFTILLKNGVAETDTRYGRNILAGGMWLTLPPIGGSAFYFQAGV